MLGQRELLAVDAARVEQGLDGAGLAAQRARLAHARLGVALEVVLLEVEPRERGERRRVLRRDLERASTSLRAASGSLRSSSLSSDSSRLEAGDALEHGGRAAERALELDALLEHARRLVREARAAQVAQHGGHELVVADGLVAELAHGGRGGLGVGELVLEDARAPAHELDALGAAREAGAPAQRLLQVVEAAVRLVEAIEGRQRLGVVGRMREDRLVGLDGAVGLARAPSRRRARRAGAAPRALAASATRSA